MASKAPSEQRSELELEQIALERRYCAGLFSGFDYFAREHISWLPPEYFLDKSLGEYWRKVRDGIDRVQAANESGIFGLLNQESQNMYVFPVEEDASQIQDLAFMREILVDMSRLSTDIRSRNITSLRSHIDSLKLRSSTRSQDVLTVSDIGDKFKEHVKNPTGVVHTRLALDTAIGGLFGGELILLAARPGMGKTALSMQFARTAAMDKKRVLFVSLEMSAVQLWARMACPSISLEWRNVRSGDITKPDKVRLASASDALVKQYENYLFINDSSYMPTSIHQRALTIKPDIVIVDQLPEMIWHDPSAKVIEWYGAALKYLRTYIARGMGIPVVVVHQLSRAVESRTDKRPVLSDLRDSGEIEQRADVVMFLYRDDYYNGRLPGQVNVPAEVLVLKNRQGDTAKITVDYHLKEQWFR